MKSSGATSAAHQTTPSSTVERIGTRTARSAGGNPVGIQRVSE